MQTSLSIALVCACAVVSASSARAENAERIANIRKAATEIAAAVSAKGAKETLAGIVDCYRRELAVAKSLTPNLETCMAQDIIVSKISAAFYSKIGKAGRRVLRSPDPKAVMDAMQQRVNVTLQKFSMSERAAHELDQLVEKYGVEAYRKAERLQELPGQKK
jgi:hypothetical protein